MNMITTIKKSMQQFIQPQNALLIIHPYYHKEAWVFDDEEKGLVKEPFVAGADDFIEYILTKCSTNPTRIMFFTGNGCFGVFKKTTEIVIDDKVKGISLKHNISCIA